MEDFISCGLCKDGYLYDIDIAYKCRCLKTYQRVLRLTHLLKKANIPLYLSENKSILDYSIDDYKGKDEAVNLLKIKSFITNFESYKRRHLFFSGAVGTQKSTLLRYMGMELLDKGYSVYYTLADTLIKELQDADRDEILKEKLHKIITYDFLIIDEMSEDKITTYKSGWQNKFLLPFLKKRMEVVRLSTAFASNSPIENIGEFFAGATQDLIYREVADKTMVFKDNHEHEKNDFDIKDLWK